MDEPEAKTRHQGSRGSETNTQKSSEMFCRHSDVFLATSYIHTQTAETVDIAETVLVESGLDTRETPAHSSNIRNPQTVTRDMDLQQSWVLW